jgi:hypothetical protein
MRPSRAHQRLDGSRAHARDVLVVDSYDAVANGATRPVSRSTRCNAGDLEFILVRKVELEPETKLALVHDEDLCDLTAVHCILLLLKPRRSVMVVVVQKDVSKNNECM